MNGIRSLDRTLRGVIEIRNGTAYAVYRHRDLDRPIETANLWRIYSGPGDNIEQLRGKECQIDNHRVYVTISTWITYQLDIDLRCDYAEQAEVKRPKSKVETRWHGGQWQKYLKTKGWVAA